MMFLHQLYVSEIKLLTSSVLLFRSPVADQLMVNSLLTLTLREPDDFGIYSCTVRNASSDFCLHNLSKTT